MRYTNLSKKKKVTKSILYQLKQKEIKPLLTIESKTNTNSLMSIVINNNINFVAILKTMSNKKYNKIYVDFSWNLINDYFIEVFFFESKKDTENKGVK